MKLLRKLIGWMMMVCVIGLNAGCATTGGSYCDIARPIWWDSTEQLDATPPGITRQIVVHNETVAALCR